MLQESSENPRSLKFVVMFFLLLMLPFLAISWYVTPSLDDYGHAVRLRALGFVGAQKLWLLTWTGRYFSTPLISACNYLVHAGGCWLIPAALIAGLFFAFRALISSLSSPGPGNGKARLTAGALALVAIYLCHMPQPATGLYWNPGAGTYQVPNVLLLLLLAILIRATSADDGKGKGGLVAAGFLIFAVIGSSEPHMLMALAILSTGFAIAATTGHRSRWRWLCLWIVGLACAALFLGLPGNRGRLVACDDIYRRFPLQGMMAAVRYSKILFLSWAFDATLISASILFTPLAFDAAGRIPALRLRARWLWALPPVWLATFTAVSFACFYSTGGEPPPRVLNALFLFFLLGWFMTAAIAVAWFVKPRSEAHGIPRYLILASAGVLAANLTLQTNFTPVLKDLLLRAPAYKRQVAAREALVRSAVAAGVADLIVPPLVNPPTTCTFGGIGPDATFEQNRDYAAYWRLKSISVAPPVRAPSGRP